MKKKQEKPDVKKEEVHEHEITKHLEPHRAHNHTNLHREQKHDRRIKIVALYALITIPMLLIVYMATKGYRPATLPSDKIRLVMPNHLKSGEPVIFSIVNDTDQTIYIENHCPDVPFSVYKWDGKNWDQQHSINKTKVCKDEERNIAVNPHSKAPGSYSEWPDVFRDKGLYQINTEVEGYDQVLSHNLLIESL